MISDKFRFTVTSDSSHQLLRTGRGVCFTHHYALERDRNDSGVLVLAGIVYSDTTPLHIFVRGSVTLKRYWRQIILDHVRLFRDAVRAYFLFMYYSVRPRRDTQVLNIPESEDNN